MGSIKSMIHTVIQQMDESHLKDQLNSHFPKHSDSLAVIENSFDQLTKRKQDTETLNCFFHSWGQTNNSAMTVSGLSNRITMHLYKGHDIASEHDLFKSLASLNRITDEDLAVTGKVLHSQLFYVMATEICGNDQWLSRNYLSDEAIAFKEWKDHSSLHVNDVMIGLLTTLVHEIYTHGEVEYILPKFTSWLDGFGFPVMTAKRTLAWIKVHCGATERDHFFHAVNAVNSYAKAMDLDVADYDLGEIISTYLELKAKVMTVVIDKAEALAA